MTNAHCANMCFHLAYYASFLLSLLVLYSCCSLLKLAFSRLQSLVLGLSRWFAGSLMQCEYWLRAKLFDIMVAKIINPVVALDCTDLPSI